MLISSTWRTGVVSAALVCAACTVASIGCRDEAKPTSTAGSPAPSLDSTDPAERAAAAREAEKKYGAQP